MAQHGIDMRGNRRAVLHAGEAMAAKIGADNVVRRRVGGLDIGEQPDRGGDARAGRHCRMPSEILAIIR